MDRELRVQIEDHRPIAVLQLNGFCAQLEVYKLKSEAEWLISDGNRFVVLDLGNLTFIDSAGIGVIMQLGERCRSVSGLLAFACPPNSNARRLLGAAFASFGNEFYDSVADAVKVLKRRFGLGPSDESDGDGPNEMEQLRARIENIEGRLEQLEKALLRFTHPAD